MKTAIIFDLDGTLLDTLQDLHDGVNFMLDTLGCPRRSLEEVRSFVGNGARLLVERSLPAQYPHGEEAFRLFKAYYDAHCRVKTAPYPGIPEALAVLAEQYPLAIVSNKPDSAVKTLCADFFPGIPAWGESPDCPRKPEPDMVNRAMESLGARRCVYVGDSEVDVVTANNAGAVCVSVLWGFRNRDQLEDAGAAHFCENPGELPRKIGSIGE